MLKNEESNGTEEIGLAAPIPRRRLASSKRGVGFNSYTSSI